MATAYQFGIKLSVDGEQQVVAATDKAGKGFEDLGTRADTVGEIAERVRGRLLGLAAAYVGTQTVRAFLDTADAMQGMESRLKNVIGRTGDYEGAVKDLYRISQTNNVSIQDTATLYTRLLPTLEKMGGDTRHASLMTETLSTALRVNKASASESSSAILQFSQAMASGVLRGEEFNSVNEASPQFLDALATSLGVSKGELRKMAEEGKLTADVVGNEMPTMMRILQRQTYDLKDTLSDAMSDMGNDTSLLVVELNKATGTTDMLTDAVDTGASFFRQFTGILKDNAGASTVAGQGFDAMGVAIRVAGTVAEAVLLVTSDVTYVLRGLGREIGGIAAQVVAVATGNFAQAQEIGRSMVLDAELARSELTKYQTAVSGMTDKVLQSRAALREHGLSAKENGDELQRLTGHSGNTAGGYDRLRAATNGSKEADKEKQAALKALAADEKRQGELLTELSGFSKDYATKTGDLAVLFAKGRLSLDDFTKAHDDLLARQPGVIANTKAMKDATDAEKKSRDELKKAYDTHLDSLSKEADSLDSQTAKLREENATIGKTKSELAGMSLARLDERIAIAEQVVATDELLGYCNAETAAHRRTLDSLKDLRGATKDNAYIQAADEARKSWEKTADEVSRGLTDSLFRAFESGGKFFSTLWDGVKNTFKTTVLKPIIEDVLTPFKQVWRTVYDEINTSLIQPLIAEVWRPFKDAFLSVARDIASTVIRPVINAIVSPITGGISAFFGGTGAANAGTGTTGSVAGGLGSLTGVNTIANGIGSLFPTVGGAISSAGAAVSGWFSGASIGASSATGAGALATNAALAESAVAATAGGAAAGAGLMSTIAAAAPYVAAVIAIVSLLSRDRGGPKQEGAFNSGGLAGIPGGGQLDQQAAQLFGSVQSTYAGLATALGGTAGTLTGATFIGKDPQGTANTQFVLDAVLNGQQIYSRNNRTGGGNVEDVGRSDGDLASAITYATNQAVLRALQETDLGNAEINARIDSISAAASSAEIERALAAVVSYKEQIDAVATTTVSGSSVIGGGGVVDNTAAIAELTSSMAGYATLYSRTASATELTAQRAAQAQTWIYEAADGNANRVRQAVYDGAANDTTTRNSLVDAVQQLGVRLEARLAAEVQKLCVQIYNSEQQLLTPARESADALMGASRGGLALKVQTV